MNPIKTIRLDHLLVEKGLAESGHRAQALILAGQVIVNGSCLAKAGTLVPNDANIEVLKPLPYVGRGGVKLDKALESFSIDPKNWVCLDVGSSTGGFTDCLLQKNAMKIYAVDVGRGQLAWRLRQDPRVICMEKVNARYLSAKEIPEEIRLCVMDVSFISVKKILPALKPLVFPKGEFVVLVKPQFEAEPGKTRKGIVDDKDVHVEVLQNMITWSNENGFFVRGITHSPVKGGDGNIEFFLHLDSHPPAIAVDPLAMVHQAYLALRASS